jgi:hypothetical protein
MSTAMTGTITKVRKDRKGFFIDGEWYSVYVDSEMDGANKGSNVSFTFVKKGDWNNVDNGSVKVNAQAAPAPGGAGGKTYSGGGDKQFRTVPELTRIDALKLAVETVNGAADNLNLKTAAQAALKLAPVYVAFIEGTLAGAPAGAATTAAGTNAADEAAKAAAEAAQIEEARKADEAAAAAEAAQVAQAAAGQGALDDFLAG